ncbi:MAG: serine/threonine protein kinase, partial [Deltaproteobacteria bacterium]|nr:serine/threonine protein kinase [Deltaproteobacteria bacterium]
AERFEREAKLTGRLDHPNIVPIYDFGTLGVGKKLFLSMKRIRGRDLGKLLKAIGQGDQASRRTYSRARLLRVFQDICLGMAFAHSRGVIHRDLKPSNIMIGDFGETFIVDWGIAKTLQDPPPESESAPTASGPRVSGRKPTLTIEGEILGTPAYMSPEQADGLNAVLDVRSDIFSLGAILYEILTLRPAFEGLTAEEVMDKVRFGAVTPPGARLLQVRAERQLRDSRLAAAGSPIRTVADDFPGPVPAELDSICMKAMARTKEDRYAGAMELHREVQLFLEGVKERERAGRESRELVQAGNRHLERFRELQWTIESQRDAIVELRDCIRPHESLEAKRNLWAAESRLRALEEERIGEFTQANAAFGQALIVDAGNSEASIGKCELFLDGYLEAEQRRDRKGMILHRNTLAQYDRGGRYRARLETPGRLTLRTWEYECECARPVQDRSWRVEFGGEPEIPWRSGRPLP